ncbi:metallophosphoesterase [Candidatus Oscillochloris fontis]|uniref:metallophosphoesterase n=1 Tax=Candidatus Oscillochloris fontis TaxID=2496868 RepID=UPI00101D455D|nr:metallophosphoesterase [Candidatus Oscillochloris fontis]
MLHSPDHHDIHFSFPHGLIRRLRRLRFGSNWLWAGGLAALFAVLTILYGGWRALLALFAAAGATILYALHIEPTCPHLERRDLFFPNLPPGLEGLRIGHLSDLHIGHRFAAQNTRWAVAQMLREQPDLLVITGDLVSYARNIVDLPDLLRPLHAPLGVFAVPGNHDRWEGLEEIVAAIQPLGIEFLINQQRRLTWRGTELTLAGVDDAWNGQMDLVAALADTPQNQFSILLCHLPDMLEAASARGVDLQLSGHTHGGHVHLPWLGSLVLPRHGWRYPIGHARYAHTQIYVSRGLGGLPLRFGCRPEATILTLRRQPFTSSRTT